MFVILIVLSVLFFDIANSSLKTFGNKTTYDLSDHTMVTSSNVFPYVAAILKKSQYLCAGALLSESWVMTVADSVYPLRDTLRLIRVHLGSINYKKGGKRFPVKLIELHPYFDDRNPEYDMALMQLARPARLTASLSPIRLQKRPKEIMATHFIVTSWPVPHTSSSEMEELMSKEFIERRRTLQVAHLHPMKPQKCAEILEDLTFSKNNLMCLDQGDGADTCNTDVGAPVVLNGILWGLVSSWVPENCDLLPGPTFVIMTSAPNISTWVHTTLKGTKWHQQLVLEEDYDDYDDDDD